MFLCLVRNKRFPAAQRRKNQAISTITPQKQRSVIPQIICRAAEDRRRCLAPVHKGHTMKACFFVSTDMHLAQDPALRHAVEAMGFRFELAGNALGIHPDSEDIVILDIRSIPINAAEPPPFLRKPKDRARVVGVVRNESTEHHALLLDLGVDTVVPAEPENLPFSLTEAIREIS